MKSLVKILLVFIFYVLAVSSAFADVNYIDVSKITKSEKLTADFKYLKDNLQYYSAWASDWKYDVPKTDVITKLQEIYKDFSNLSLTQKDKNNGELFLLLGDIAHYLNNLDAGDSNTDYKQIAWDNYKKAIKLLSKDDYRGYWFLGVHYSDDYLIQAVDNFESADQIGQGKQMPGDFWADYANLSIKTAMPSHYLYAMDQIPGVKPLYTKDRLIKPINKNHNYPREELWKAIEKNGDIFFISRPLGMRFHSGEEVMKYGLLDYQDNKTIVIVSPPSIKNKDGKDVSYQIVIDLYTSQDKKSLEEFVNSNEILKSYSDKKEIKLFDNNKYDKMVAYEFVDVDKEVSGYKDFGGAHFYFVVVERDKPQYPGLTLEIPTSVPVDTSSIISRYDRFDGKIFYMFWLNTREDIHEEGLKVFKDFFENRLIIE